MEKNSYKDLEMNTRDNIIETCNKELEEAMREVVDDCITDMCETLKNFHKLEENSFHFLATELFAEAIKLSSPDMLGVVERSISALTEHRSARISQIIRDATNDAREIRAKNELKRARLLAEADDAEAELDI